MFQIKYFKERPKIATFVPGKEDEVNICLFKLAIFNRSFRKKPIPNWKSKSLLWSAHCCTPYVPVG